MRSGSGSENFHFGSAWLARCSRFGAQGGLPGYNPNDLFHDAKSFWRGKIETFFSKNPIFFRISFLILQLFWNSPNQNITKISCSRSMPNHFLAWLKKHFFGTFEKITDLFFFKVRFFMSNRYYTPDTLMWAQTQPDDVRLSFSTVELIFSWHFRHFKNI